MPVSSPDCAGSARYAVFVAGWLIACSGCGGGGSVGDPAVSEEHSDHVIPAHKPKDFPSAVRRLRELEGQISARIAVGQARSLVIDKTLPIAIDIANWLPEIAADSEMPETPWNQVADRSATLVAAFKKIAEGAAVDDHPDGAPALATRASDDIKALETLLASADAHWFDPAMPGARP